MKLLEHEKVEISCILVLFTNEIVVFHPHASVIVLQLRPDHVWIRQ
jgi:hypothetical protein